MKTHCELLTKHGREEREAGVGQPRPDAGAGEAYVSTLRCDLCHREYTLRDCKLAEKREERDPVAENVAIIHSELETALKRRCSECGGPVTNGNGIYTLHCAWCFQEYSIPDDFLQPQKIAVADEDFTLPSFKSFSDCLLE